MILEKRKTMVRKAGNEFPAFPFGKYCKLYGYDI